mgnify:FL=1|jgi:DNA-directed RNA polymerase specialized sigma24 family protein|tara:strand:+ start:940 stop:1131 length:192 start_codon:yes stop_codon:yes gene_type:complete
MSKKYSRLTTKEKRAIVLLVEFEGWKKVEVAERFGVSRSRISQIISDTYDEKRGLGFEYGEDA